MDSVEKLVKELVREMVMISPEYQKKEQVREAIQTIIVSMIGAGKITNASDLDNFFSSADMSLNALKMVPFETYQKLTGK